MTGGYPIHTFTPEKPELVISFNTGMKLTISKFISNNDFDFKTLSLIVFQVLIKNKKPFVRSFASLISATQKDFHVLEFKLPFRIEEPGTVHIKIIDKSYEFDYSISMAYDIEPL